MNTSISVTNDGVEVGRFEIARDEFAQLYSLLDRTVRDRNLAQKKFEESGQSLRDYNGFVPEPSITHTYRRLFAIIQQVDRTISRCKEANRG